MRLSLIVAGTVAIVAAIAIVRGARGADQHPAMTADHPPGWRLYATRPGEDTKPRGRFSDSLTSCMLDLHSDAIVQPKGTKLACLYVQTDGTVRR